MSSDKESPDDDETGLPLSRADLLAAVRGGGLKASKDAMEVMGYIVVAQDGWIVKKYKDGTVVRLEKIGSTKDGGTESRPNN